MGKLLCWPLGQGLAALSIRTVRLPPSTVVRMAGEGNRSLDRGRWVCRSYTTRISEVEHAGSPKERVLPPDTGYGFLWRLYSYWRFQEREGGVYVECRAISLTRDVPLGLRWIIEPIIQKLPKGSLINTLEATRQALLAEARQFSASRQC